MSFLKEFKKIEPKPIVKQSVKQTRTIVKQEKVELNPNVNSIDDIPNTNIMTAGILLGVSLRANKKQMLENLKKYIDNLLEK